MLRIARFWFSWLSALALVSAQAAAQPAAGAVCADPGSSMLWQVQGAGLDSKGITLHLFGSIHIGKPGFYPLHPRIEAIFRNADNLVFEIDPQAAADPQVALRMQLRGMLPAGQTLPDVVSPQALANLQGVLDQLGIPLANFMTMKPWLLTLLLANVQASALGYSAEHGLESYFIAQKSPRGRVLELESIEQQVDILDSLDPEAFLGYSIKDFSGAAEEMQTLITAWQCADKEALSATLLDGLAAAEEPGPDEQNAMDAIYRTLFTDRNLRMADGIENFIRTGSGSWFVVVGSAHLLGEGSVVDLLQQRGYQVNPIWLD
jgi:hypothetical protein